MNRPTNEGLVLLAGLRAGQELMRMVPKTERIDHSVSAIRAACKERNKSESEMLTVAILTLLETANAMNIDLTTAVLDYMTPPTP